MSPVGMHQLIQPLIRPLETPDWPAAWQILRATCLPGDTFAFPPDMDRVDADVNRLNNQALVRYFEAEWARYVH